MVVLTGLTLDNSYGLKGIKQQTGENTVEFTLGSNANLMLVREWGGRFVLAQGYHRAWMLRSKGVEMIPAVVARIPKPHDLAPPNLLPHIVSARPPTIDDFLDDAVSVDAEVRSTMTSVKITIETSIVPRLL